MRGDAPGAEARGQGLQGGYSQFWKQREVVINGVAYSDLHEAYKAQDDSVDKTIRAINTGKLLTTKDKAPRVRD